MNYTEKRLFKRINADLAVDIQTPQQGQVKTTSLNVSCGGMFLRLDPHHVAELKHFELVIHLPNQKKPVKLAAEVLRSEGEAQAGVVVQFQGLYNDHWLEIEKFIKNKLN